VTINPGDLLAVAMPEAVTIINGSPLLGVSDVGLLPPLPGRAFLPTSEVALEVATLPRRALGEPAPF